jgi:hypothetical protein
VYLWGKNLIYIYIYLYLKPGISGFQEVNLIFPKFQDVQQILSPDLHSPDPLGEFSTLLHDTGFEVINCEYRQSEYNYKSLSSFRGECGIHIKLILKIIFMKAISLWLLLNKPHSFSLTQHKFINQFNCPHIHATCFLQACQLKCTGRYD